MKSVFSVVGRSLVAAMLLCSVAACASSGGKKAQVKADYPTLMSKAEAEVAAGRIEPALVAFNEAAKADPTRKDAWVRTAQVHLNSGNYGRAIVAAEEVLKRDQTDLVADSVLTVAGLQVAQQSLQRLRSSDSMESNPQARASAEQLLAALREVLPEREVVRNCRVGTRWANGRCIPVRAPVASPDSGNTPSAPKDNAKSCPANDPFCVLGNTSGKN